MLKVLIVDDSFSRIELIESALGLAGLLKYLKVTRSYSADSARSELLVPFDVMLLDVVLPKKDNGVPDARNSVNLLNDLGNPSKSFIRPSLIIGVTADLDGITCHQKVFLESATVVLDGRLNDHDWLDNLINNIRSLVDSTQRARQLKVDQVLISIHGIRTYGHWQGELAKEIKKYSRSFEHIEVKYGYLDFFCFFLPSVRAKRIQKLADRVSRNIIEHQGKRICIVGHSFGSVILSQALQNLVGPEQVELVIFCGSPLKEDDSIDHVIHRSKLTINECGINDNILLLSKIFVPQLGYAGRVGFYRENDSRFYNRFHVGGHSLYFNPASTGLRFFEEHWTPVIIDGLVPPAHDCRSTSIMTDLMTIFIKLTSGLKEKLPLTLFIMGVCFLMYLGFWGY